MMMKIKELINFLKSSGIIIQAYSSYNGLANTYDYGPIGSLFKEKLHQIMLREFVYKDPSSFLINSSILTKKEVLIASGHLDKFEDYFVDCKKCKSRFRIEKGKTLKKCPLDNSTDLTSPRSFNLLFKTKIGALLDSQKDVYLRPETAQSIFANFNYYKKIWNAKIPFSICQFGKAFRNEIVPANFLYRMLEFEQFEIEKFIEEENWEKEFASSVNTTLSFLSLLKLNNKKLKKYYQKNDELAHYSKKTLDLIFHFPFGWNELLGISYRQNYDLSMHQQHSKTNMEMINKENKKFIPHVIEVSFGIDRLLFALFLSWFKKETLENGDERIILKCPPFLAPYTVTIIPLSSKLRSKAKSVFKQIINDALKENINININISSTSIGKKYRKSDEIGIPYCLTIDFQTLEDDSITLRFRDSMKQERLKINNVINYIKKKNDEFL